MKYLKVENVDGNKELVGKQLKLMKTCKDSIFLKGTIVTCVGLSMNDNFMKVKANVDSYAFDFLYSGELWAVVEPEDEGCDSEEHF